MVSGAPSQAVVISDVVGQRGGAYRATALLSEALCDIGLKTTTFARWVEPDFKVPRERWKIVRPLIGRGSRWQWPEKILARQAAAWIERTGPNLVLVVGLTSLCARMLRLVQPHLIWVWELTNAAPGNKFVDCEVVQKLNRARGVLSPAKIIDDAIRSNYGYDGPIERLPFWIEPGPGHYLPPPHTFSCDFLFLSRREDDKGLTDLIRATAIVAKTFRNFRVLVAGPGPAACYMELAEKLQLTDIIDFRTLVSRSEAMEVLANTRYVVLPSHHEGFPISILEGTQRSIPFITTPVGAIPEMLGNSDACLYHEPGDIVQLASLFQQVMTEPTETYVARRTAAFRRYDVHQSSHAIHQILRRIAAQPQAPHLQT